MRVQEDRGIKFRTRGEICGAGSRLSNEPTARSMLRKKHEIETFEKLIKKMSYRIHCGIFVSLSEQVYQPASKWFYKNHYHKAFRTVWHIPSDKGKGMKLYDETGETK